MEKTYTVDESVGAVNVCVNLTHPPIDILEETVNVFVIDYPNSIYIRAGAPLASEWSHNCISANTYIVVLNMTNYRTCIILRIEPSD